MKNKSVVELTLFTWIHFFWGGRILPHEIPWQTARRKFFEETGCWPECTNVFLFRTLIMIIACESLNSLRMSIVKSSHIEWFINFWMKWIDFHLFLEFRTWLYCILKILEALGTVRQDKDYHTENPTEIFSGFSRTIQKLKFCRFILRGNASKRRVFPFVLRVTRAGKRVNVTKIKKVQGTDQPFFRSSNCEQFLGRGHFLRVRYIGWDSEPAIQGIVGQKASCLWLDWSYRIFIWKCWIVSQNWVQDCNHCIETVELAMCLWSVWSVHKWSDQAYLAPRTSSRTRTA